MKTVLIIGAGRFGRHLATDLCNMGNEVMLVDRNENLIEEYSHLVTTAEIGDYTLKSNLEALGVEDYDYIFVCIGELNLGSMSFSHRFGPPFKLKPRNAPVCILSAAHKNILSSFLLIYNFEGRPSGERIALPAIYIR